MKYYECPNCGKEKLYPKSKAWYCLECKQIFDFKHLTRQQLHHKNHIDNPDFVIPDKDLVKKKPTITKKSKQHCEHITQQALRTIPNIWYTKLQVNPNAHTPTVGDYLVLTNEHNIVLECKELDTNKNNIIPFSRFTQIGNMTAFEKSLQKNNAYFVILLWSKTKNHGLTKNPHELYVIPLKSIQAHISLANKKSMNIKEIQTNFESYKVQFENLSFYFKKLFL